MKWSKYACMILFFLATLVASQPIKRGGCSNDYLAAVSEVVDTITGIFEGFATFFHPVSEGGPLGACGPRENDNSDIVALNLHQYGNANQKSEWCGKKVWIRAGAKSTVATITDACPGCKENSLDLTPAVFNRLADPVIGVIPIKWCVIGTPGCNYKGGECD